MHNLLTLLLECYWLSFTKIFLTSFPMSYLAIFCPDSSPFDTLRFHIFWNLHVSGLKMFLKNHWTIYPMTLKWFSNNAFPELTEALVMWYSVHIYVKIVFWKIEFRVPSNGTLLSTVKRYSLSGCMNPWNGNM